MQDSLTNLCPLCQSNSRIFYHFKERLYHQCNNCLGIFVDEELIPSRTEEKTRYEEHNNDILDPGYQVFVSPITNAVMKDFTNDHIGLDFGAGPGPVIAKVLEDHGYQISKYDPFYFNTPELLKVKYDYIVCCEVIEHFHQPFNEFKLLQSILKKNGSLFCMTDIYDSKIDFHKWYYKNDKTHVFIYQRETLEWIKESLKFNTMLIEKRLITFTI